MKKITNYICLALLSFAFVSCGDSHTGLTEDMLDHLDEVSVILKDLADGGSVEDAIKEFEDLSEGGKDLQARMKELGDPDEETEKKLEEEFDERMEASQKKISDLMTDLQKNGKITPELMKAMASVMPDSE